MLQVYPHYYMLYLFGLIHVIIQMHLRISLEPIPFWSHCTTLFAVNRSTYDVHMLLINILCILFRAVLSATIAFVCVLCYCCNRSINKRSMTIYQQRWMEGLNDPNMGIYSVEQVPIKPEYK